MKILKNICIGSFFFMCLPHVSFADTPEQLFKKGAQYIQQGNHIKAKPFFEKAAKKGLAEAQYNLALLYYYGSAGEQNYKKAIDLLTKAASAGDPDAPKNLGIMYEYGQGTQPNLYTASYWYKIGCQRKDEGACNSYDRLSYQYGIY